MSVPFTNVVEFELLGIDAVTSGSGVIALPVYSLFPTVSIVLLLPLISYATIFHVIVLSADV